MGFELDPKLEEDSGYNGNHEDQPDRSLDAYPLHHHSSNRVHFHAYAPNLSLGRDAVKVFRDDNGCRDHVCEVCYHDFFE